MKIFYDYEFVACGTIPRSKMAKCHSQNPITSMCLENNGGAFALGVINSTIVKENALIINYDGGDKFWNLPGAAVLTITCDPKMDIINMTSANIIMGSLTWRATAHSKYGCSLICNGHGKYTSSGCICDVGYSGTYCTNKDQNRMIK